MHAAGSPFRAFSVSSVPSVVKNENQEFQNEREALEL